MKALVIILISLLTIYAPLELSRLIIVYKGASSFFCELFLIWSFYLIALKLLILKVRV